MSQSRHIAAMSRVLAHVDENLDEEIDIEALAGLACYSPFHFHRLFRAFCGESVYARRKRLLLERAAKHLMHSELAIGEIAYRCGYDNQASFNKAFRQQFGQTPGDVRKKATALELEPEPPANPTRGCAMTPKVIEIEDIPVIAARETGGGYQQAASRAWGRLMKFAYSNRLMKKDTRLIGISHDDPNVTEPDHIRFDACLDIEAEAVEAHELSRRIIAGGRYARFIHRGPYDKLGETYASAFNQWLPSSSFKLRDVPCFEIYLNRDPRRTKPENLRTEIYVPLQ